MITEIKGNETFLRLISENENDKTLLKDLSRTLIDDNIVEFIALFEEGEIFLQINNMNFIKFLHS